MSLFIKQTEQRTQLQEKIAADLVNRVQPLRGDGGEQPKGAVMEEERTQATGKSLFWVGVGAMLVVALVVFVLFVSEAI